MRAIVVEDEGVVARSLQQMLGLLDFDVQDDDVLLDTTSLLLTLARHPPPGLVIIDFCLPGEWDGIDALTAIRSSALTGRPPAVLIISGKAVMTRGQSLAIADKRGTFLAKPFTLSELSKAIHVAMVEAAKISSASTAAVLMDEMD